MYRGGNLSHMIQGWRFFKLGWHSYDTGGRWHGRKASFILRCTRGGSDAAGRGRQLDPSLFFRDICGATYIIQFFFSSLFVFQNRQNILSSLNNPTLPSCEDFSSTLLVYLNCLKNPPVKCLLCKGTMHCALFSFWYALYLYLCICVFVYLRICVFVYLCICVFMYLCI